MGIFKAYDVRGVYPSELNEELAYRVGRAMVVFLKAKTVVVGRDCRQSSPALAQAVVRGAADQGANVIDIGLASSPMFSFCAGSLPIDAGVMVTASHNPPEYNGFKLCRAHAEYLSADAGIKEVEALVEKNSFPPAKSQGRVSKRDMLAKYAAHVVSFARGVKPLRVVVDAGNGMCGLVCPPVFAKLPVAMTPVFFELDGRFPNRPPNPMYAAHLTALVLRMKKEQAHLGIAFDPDGDRVSFVDEQGQLVSSDLVTALISEEVSAREADPLVLYDVRSSRAVPEFFAKAGVRSCKTRVGHAFIKAEMRAKNASFAGELSGHFYFRDHFFCDSGVIASMFVLSLMSRTGKPLSELVRPLKKYVSTGEVNFSVKSIPGVLAALKDRFKDGHVEEMDGVAVMYPDWWCIVRGSNTEPVVRMIVEAESQQVLEKKKAAVEGVIREFAV